MGLRWAARRGSAAIVLVRPDPTPEPTRPACVSRLRIAGFKPFADPGQCHDVTRSHKLVDGFEPDAVITDKRYDADPLRDAIRDVGTQAVMPPRSNRKAPTPTTRRFRERNLAERFVSKRKQLRRVAARYDKLLPNYEGLV